MWKYILNRKIFKSILKSPRVSNKKINLKKILVNHEKFQDIYFFFDCKDSHCTKTLMLLLIFGSDLEVRQKCLPAEDSRHILNEISLMC